jgi:hypothetical protein
VVDQLYANAAQWVETSTIKSGACMMLGLPNGHGVWHHRFVVLTPWYLHAAVPMLPGQGISGRRLSLFACALYSHLFFSSILFLSL